MHTTDHYPSTPAPSLTRRLDLARVLANAALFGLWLWLYRPVFGYLAVIFSREDFRTNQLVLAGVLGLIAWQWRQGAWRPRPDAPPRLHLPALGLALGGSILFLLVERFLDVNTLSASLFALASYGLLGLWLAPARWRRGLPAALLLVGALPLGDHLQTFVGYPMRTLTAALVRDGLAAAGVGSVGVDTILIFENGVSQVDLPCSGVKSLWTGALFLIAATWIERRPLNARWWLTALAFAGLLFAANLARVGALIVVGEVLGQRLMAQMLHVPLGVLSFAAACAAALGLLRAIPPQADDALASSAPAPTWLAPALAVVVLGLSLLYAPRPHTGLTAPLPDWVFPAPLSTRPLPLKPDEIDWLTRDGAETAQRLRFEWRGLTGSMILITSRTWRAHHRPERCFEVYGLRLEDSRTRLVQPDFPVRVVALGGGSAAATYAAVYWFQSAQTITDDYSARIWADLAPQRARWVLASVLFDGGAVPDDDLDGLALVLRGAIEAQLKGTSP